MVDTVAAELAAFGVTVECELCVEAFVLELLGAEEPQAATVSESAVIATSDRSVVRSRRDPRRS